MWPSNREAQNAAYEKASGAAGVRHTPGESSSRKSVGTAWGQRGRDPSASHPLPNPTNFP